MIRLVASLLVVFGCVGLAAVVIGWSQLSDWRYRRRIDRRQVVLDEAIQQNARDNYLLLQRSIRAMQQVLDGDAVMPSLSTDLRRELLTVVSDFNQEALPKGTK